jgi:hypothetical protein
MSLETTILDDEKIEKSDSDYELLHNENTNDSESYSSEEVSEDSDEGDLEEINNKYIILKSEMIITNYSNQKKFKKLETQLSSLTAKIDDFIKKLDEELRLNEELKLKEELRIKEELKKKPINFISKRNDFI